MNDNEMVAENATKSNKGNKISGVQMCGTCVYGGYLGELGGKKGYFCRYLGIDRRLRDKKCKRFIGRWEVDSDKRGEAENQQESSGQDR